MTQRTRLFAKTASAVALAIIGLAHPATGSGFQTPSGNITCYLNVFSDRPSSEMSMACLIFEADWDAPPEFGAEPCDLDRTRMVTLPPRGPAEAVMTCHGDVFWPIPQGKLSYGSQWSLNDFTCGVAQDGVRCRNQDHGFHLRRSSVSFD